MDNAKSHHPHHPIHAWLLSVPLLLAGGPDIAAAKPADLALTVSASPNPVLVNGQLNFGFEVENQGPGVAKQIVLTGKLPGGTQFSSASPGCKLAKNNVLRCKAKKLNKGLKTRWTLTVQPMMTGDFPVNATVKNAGKDKNKANNTTSASATALFTINQPPTANGVSKIVDPSSRFIVQPLIATDPDQDVLTFELLAPGSGTGFSLASIDPKTGVFTLTIDPDFNGVFDFPYRATDGILFSDIAHIVIDVSPIAQSQKGTGSTAIDPEAYAKAVNSKLSSALQGTPGTAPTEPPSVDLSPFFPVPGDQGRQNSCVGWATAYAIKSYQEGREIDWSLDSSAHVFSPAYIYNQINNGVDRGSRLDQGLQLIVEQGAASWTAMPYSEGDFLTQPSDQARIEAAQYRANSWKKTDGTDAMKAALINRQPVVVAINACDSFQSLTDANAAYQYNPQDGHCFGHAVTVVGYDNNLLGGAFKLINSWGTRWGDKGFFWIPYSSVTQLINYAFTLEDKENTEAPTTVPPTGDLPNLQIQSFTANYNAAPGGKGLLQWSIINAGVGTAPAGVNVNLMLSDNPNISTNDTYVVYETIPFELKPSVGVNRDATNPIPFTFPNYVAPGTYYLALWVDDLNVAIESNENDNIGLSAHQVAIAEGLPDLRIEKWNLEGDANNSGKLTYTILNAGGIDAPGGWETSLVLSKNQIIGDGDEITLFAESVPGVLASGYTTYRDSANPAYVKLDTSASGQAIPAGVYYIAFWADSQQRIHEAAEANNTSVGGGTVEVDGTPGSGLRMAATQSTLADAAPGVVGGSYNGHSLPVGQSVTVQKIQVIAAPDGGRRIETLGQQTAPLVRPEQDQSFAKTVRSRNQAIFPVQEWLSMPKVD